MIVYEPKQMRLENSTLVHAKCRHFYDIGRNSRIKLLRYAQFDFIYFFDYLIQLMMNPM